MDNPPDFYKVLNIPRDSSPRAIRRAYKALVKKWHPDKHPSSSKPHAEAQFKAIAQAYEALNNQEYRSMCGVHDSTDSGIGGSVEQRAAAQSSPSLRPQRQHHESDDSRSMYDFKTSMTSMMTRMPFSSVSNSLQRKPPPMERKLECTLEELYRGCKKEVKFTREITTENGLIVQKQETQTIRVKPGWKKGTRITFEGMGGKRPGVIAAADVVFLISEKEHPVFKRVGNDLVLKVEVPLVNALTGWTFSFRLLSGEKMHCSFQDKIIHPGYEKVIKGQGMPSANEKGVRGDLRIKFIIIFPNRLSAEKRSGIIKVLHDGA